jgi:hypothetical protein
MERDRNLVQVVLALSPPRGFPRPLNGRQQQCDKDRDNCNYDQEFNKREPARATKCFVG